MRPTKLTRWTLEGVLAEKFRAGRVFLAGDAAHRHPPTGGLGLTSAVQDVHNLCWKLKAVLDGKADDSLLNTYEAERKPTDGRNIQRSLENSHAHLEIGMAFGLYDAAFAALGRIHGYAARRSITGITRIMSVTPCAELVVACAG